MRREITETAKTVEEAINSACAKLGCDRDGIEFEIVDLPKKTFLGLKTIPAKVRVWKEEEDKPEPEKREVQQRQQPAKKQQPAPEVQQPRPKPRQEEPRPVKEEKLIEMTGDVAAKAEAGKAYLSSVCREMGLEPIFSARIEDSGLCINVEGDGLGAMIGRRGETLDALQYLTGLVVNRLEGDYLRVTVDCGDYRTKRKSTLEALAKKLSAQVLKTNTSKTLEPMNPFERRIIHATVSEIEGVSSTSIGEEPNRRVVITTPTARPVRGTSRGSRDNSKSPRPGGDDRRRSGGGGRGRRGAPPRREPRLSTQGGTINTLPQQGQRPSEAPAAAPPQAAQVAQPQQAQPQPPKATPETSSADKPLYTKLDLE